MVDCVRSGSSVGLWTVLEDFELTPRGEKKWHCQCECGTERYVSERALLYGVSESCGCAREPGHRPGAYDLLGHRFGDLEVVGRRRKSGKSGTLWTCLCDCGYTCDATTSELVSGRRTHCGCKSGESFIDITGRRFGRLTALEPTPRRTGGGSVIWRCRCDCGTELEVSYNELMYTNLKSCGCRKKEHDQALKTFLTHVDGTSVDMLRSKKIPTDNTTGYKGVYFVRGKYMAKIVFQKKQYFLGTYENIEDAARARQEAEEVLFDGVAAHYERWKRRAEEDPKWAEENPISVRVDHRDKKLQVTLLPELPGKVG